MLGYVGNGFRIEIVALYPAATHQQVDPLDLLDQLILDWNFWNHWKFPINWKFWINWNFWIHRNFWINWKV